MRDSILPGVKAFWKIRSKPVSKRGKSRENVRTQNALNRKMQKRFHAQKPRSNANLKKKKYLCPVEIGVEILVCF